MEMDGCNQPSNTPCALSFVAASLGLVGPLIGHAMAQDMS